MLAMLPKKMKAKLNEVELNLLDYFFTVFRDELEIISKVKKANDNVRAFNLAFLAVWGIQDFCGNRKIRKNKRNYNFVLKKRA